MSKQMRTVWSISTPKNYEKKFGKHPTQKPIDLIKRIIKTATNKDGLVLDPFLGSGTTAVACEKLDRRYIGFEIDEKYYNTAKKRLKNVPEKLDKWFG